MVDLAVAMAGKQLTPFEGRDVIRSRVEITNAAGGLHEAMDFDPVELGQGETVFVLMECKVNKIRFDPITHKGEDLGSAARIHILRAEMATFVEAHYAREHIDAQKERIRLAREEAVGFQRIPGTTPEVPLDDDDDWGSDPDED